VGLTPASSIKDKHSLGLLGMRERAHLLGEVSSCAASLERAPASASRSLISKPLLMRNPIQILVSDDHTIVRQGLASLLNDQPDMEVVAEAPNGRVAVDKAIELKPDVVIWILPCR